MELKGVKKISVQATIIRADGSQEDLGMISSWELGSNKNNFRQNILKKFRTVL
jgi:hypothetical protein